MCKQTYVQIHLGVVLRVAVRIIPALKKQLYILFQNILFVGIIAIKGISADLCRIGNFTAVLLSPVCERTAEQVTDYPYDCADVNCPILLLAGTSGEFETDIVIPLAEMQKMYDKIASPKVMARRVGMTHDDMLYQAEGYVTAWFLWQLKGDEEAAKAFTGENPEILHNAFYQNVDIKYE